MSRRTTWIVAGLVVLTLAAYAPLWRNGFIDLDDEVYVTRNDEVKGGLTPRGIAWAWTTNRGGFWFPLTWMSLQLDASLFGGDERWLAVGVHAQNLLWHLGTVLLLFVFWERVTGQTWLATTVAALFAVHPLHVESVAWATERKDVLSTFFWMLTLLAYASYVELPSPGRYFAVVAALLLGLLAKPMLVTLPCVLLLLDYWPMRRWPVAADAPRGNARTAVWLVVEKAPLFALAVLFSVITVYTQRGADAVVPTQELSMPSRWANAAASYGWYLQRTFWPDGLAVFYTHPRNNWDWPPVIHGIVWLLAGTALALATVRRTPWIFVGWFWFVGTLVPVIGLVQVGEQARGDRFVYVPHIGLFVAIVWTAAALLGRFRVPAPIQLGLAGCAVAALGIASARQVTHWRDTVTIWEHALAVTHRNHRAHANLGGELVKRAMRADQSSPRELLDQAQAHYEQSIAIEPNIVDYHYNLGCVLLFKDELPEAEERLRASALLAAQRKGPHADSLHNLGVARLRQSKLPEAERALRAALTAGASANTHAVLGQVLWRQGRSKEAEEQWRQAHALDPRDSEAAIGLALVNLRARKEAEAVRLLTEATREQPNSAQAHSLLGVALGRLGRWPEAARSQQTAVAIETARCDLSPRRERRDLGLYQRRFGHALKMLGQEAPAGESFAAARKNDPDGPATDAARAFEFATTAEASSRDVAEAFELASQAVEALPDPTAEALDALAAAQAAAGRFDDAVRTAQRALDRADPNAAGPIRARLSLYEKRQPYLQPAADPMAAP